MINTVEVYLALPPVRSLTACATVDSSSSPVLLPLYFVSTLITAMSNESTAVNKKKIALVVF
jgi:hypothetical protein